MSKKITAILLAVVLLLATLNFIYWTGEKEGLHCDETYSYGLSNYEHGHYYKTHNEDGSIKWNTAADIDEYLAASDEHRFEYDKVIHNQKMDVHPPLHYMIIHTISSLFPGATSYWIGIVPNIIFTLGTCVLLYFLAMQIFKNKLKSILAVIFFAFSVNCINMVIYIRMYAELTFFTTAITYLLVKYADNNYKLTKPLAAFMFATIILGAYTQYYFLIFLFAPALFIGIDILIKRDMKKLLGYLAVIASSAIVYLAIWPTAITHIFKSNRGVEAFDNASSASFEQNLENYLKQIKLILGDNMILLIKVSIIICLIMLIVKLITSHDSNHKYTKKFGNCKHYVMLICTVLFYFIIITKVAPYQTDRYIAPLFPLFALIFTHVVHTAISFIIKNNIIVQNVVAYTLIILALASAVKTIFHDYISHNDYNYLYKLTDNDKRLLEENKGKRCIVVYSHEAHFLYSMADYKNFSEVAFVSNTELDALKNQKSLSNEDEVIVYINHSLEVDPICQIIMKNIGFDQCHWQFHTDRNWTHVYKLTKTAS